MHSKLREDGIPHGNIKSTNILFDEKAEPCVSEYGLMLAHRHEHPNRSTNKTPEQSESLSDAEVVYEATASRDGGFKDDVYRFGVVLLELLTGKMVQNNGTDLAKWVNSVVREEWTGEVFDGVLVSEGASEERMVNVLQVALRCISDVPGERPNMRVVTEMINSIKQEEERSTSSEIIFP
ncbi:hypothetical protein MLD38_012549 [Melastoma candidum]|nr:hypothetical protein MLD38_012549 [Melastoma candidum]